MIELLIEMPDSIEDGWFDKLKKEVDASTDHIEIDEIKPNPFAHLGAKHDLNDLKSSSLKAPTKGSGPKLKAIIATMSAMTTLLNPIATAYIESLTPPNQCEVTITNSPQASSIRFRCAGMSREEFVSTIKEFVNTNPTNQPQIRIKPFP